MDVPFSRPTGEARSCARTGCGAPGLPCSYEDATGHRCDFALCAAHGASFEGRPLCSRHVKVARALAAAPAAALAVPPAPDDRRFGVLLDAHEAISRAMVELLITAFPLQEGVEVAADALPKHVKRIDQLAWEQGWACFSRTGNLGRVVLRLPEGEPPRLEVLVNQDAVLTATPYWIARRRSGAAPDPRDRQMFARLAADAVETALSAVSRRPQWLAS